MDIHTLPRFSQTVKFLKPRAGKPAYRWNNCNKWSTHCAEADTV